ncbi:hypothetical protein EJB05_43910, partial [Eragrostis curvula]
MTPPRRPPPAALMEELVEEILLRFPPDDPARLFRAAVVCKAWRRLICGREFRRRFREFHHRTPPLLGLICRSGDSPHPLRMLPYICLARYTWSAALLCVTAGCDHLDCTSSDAFAVVFVGTDSMTTSAYVYSSEQDSWSEPVSIQDRYYTIYGPRRPGPLVGNTIYFTCFGGANKLMAFDLRKRQLSFISLPSVKFMDYHNIALIAVDEGKKLGFATAQGSKLFTWSTDDAGGLDEVVAWTRHQVFELDKLLPACNLSHQYQLFATTDNPDVIVVMGHRVLFTLDLKSGGATKLLEDCADKHIHDICSNVEQHPIPCPCHAKPYMSDTMEPKSK